MHDFTVVRSDLGLINTFWWQYEGCLVELTEISRGCYKILTKTDEGQHRQSLWECKMSLDKRMCERIGWARRPTDCGVSREKK